jgi:hypothetical protein
MRNDWGIWMKKTVRVLTPVLIAGLVAAGGTPAHAAPSAVPDGLQKVQSRQSLLGTHTWYQQTYRGIPVFGGFYATHTAGGTTTVDDGRKKITGLAASAAGVTEQRAPW